jgi:hypothetical protein
MKHRLKVAACGVLLVCAIAGEIASGLGVASMTHHTTAGLIGVLIPIPAFMGLILAMMADLMDD